ncbi:MAG: alpha/beta fold hydrolase [Gammaproteobacteria bacterium]|nr:alpha/beta fold hydrolase [Gammaproteobacteria bacterium]MDH5303822.1 alpha/beta fold hydrolase [Gammaproteobacteria bacterium]MDH5322315.1 alpha/beta fold hydrolase [Gammaproteobacteria bacterium]
MARIIVATVIIFSLGAFSACAPGTSGKPETTAMRSIDTTVESRGVAVPVTFVTPALAAGQRAPLVVMAHGHGGSRQEGGGYQLAAEAMAQRGIASIRMDFPGCGDSSEPFTNNNLSNMLQDLHAARNYAIAQPGIDADRVGLLGYSMGGRLVVLLAEVDPSYKVMVTWTPALNSGAEREIIEFGGAAKYQALRDLAQDTGVAEYTTRWGTTLQLGYRWFTDIEQTMPLASLASFKGPLLVLYGDQDDVVPPAVSEAAIAAASSSSEVVRHVVATADHALGFYTNQPEIAAEVTETTADFFAGRL